MKIGNMSKYIEFCRKGVNILLACGEKSVQVSVEYDYLGRR